MACRGGLCPNANSFPSEGGGWGSNAKMLCIIVSGAGVSFLVGTNIYVQGFGHLTGGSGM